MLESPPVREAHPEPNGPMFGWHCVNISLEEQRFASHWAELSELVKAQRGPLASVALIALPTSRATGIEPQPLGIWLCRRFRLPSLSPSATADVATDLTSLAIIEQLVPGWGCWEKEVFHWSARPPKCAGRQEDAFPPTFSSAIADGLPS